MYNPTDVRLEGSQSIRKDVPRDEGSRLASRRYIEHFVTTPDSQTITNHFKYHTDIVKTVDSDFRLIIDQIYLKVDANVNLHVDGSS
jgi:hypothetical protein